MQACLAACAGSAHAQKERLDALEAEMVLLCGDPVAEAEGGAALVRAALLRAEQLAEERIVCVDDAIERVHDGKRAAFEEHQVLQRQQQLEWQERRVRAAIRWMGQHGWAGVCLFPVPRELSLFDDSDTLGLIGAALAECNTEALLVAALHPRFESLALERAHEWTAALIELSGNGKKEDIDMIDTEAEDMLPTGWGTSRMGGEVVIELEIERWCPETQANPVADACVQAIVDVAEHCICADGAAEALRRAAACDRLAVVRTLLTLPRSRLNVNEPNSRGKTPLMLAAAFGRTNIVAALLALPPERLAVEATDAHGDTALVLATRRGYADTVAALLACERVNAERDAVLVQAARQ